VESKKVVRAGLMEPVAIIERGVSVIAQNVGNAPIA
jgi:hypothetical protein